MIQEDESIVNGSEVYSEELEESEIFCRPLPTRYTPNLDDNFNPLPIGIHGKLYVAGDGVTKGYLNKQENLLLV